MFISSELKFVGRVFLFLADWEMEDRKLVSFFRAAKTLGINIKNRTAVHRTKMMVETEKYLREREAGRALR